MRKAYAAAVTFATFMVFGTGAAFAQATGPTTHAEWRGEATGLVSDNLPEIGLTILAVAGASLVLFVGRMGLLLAVKALKGRGRRIPV